MKNLIYIILFGVLFTGCSIVDSSVKLVPNTQIKQTKNFYVVLLESDKRDIASQIAQVLVEKGFVATSGSFEEIPSNVDVVVTYEDRWFWDITNYLVRLDIQFRDPKDFYPYVAAETIRTSVARKSPKEVSSETITKIFEKLNMEGKK